MSVSDHLAIFKRRVACVEPCLIERTIASFSGMNLEERRRLLFYWPSNPTSVVAHCPLRRVQPEDYEEYYYYDFLHNHMLHRKRCMRKTVEKRKKTDEEYIFPENNKKLCTASSASPESVGKIRLVEWKEVPFIDQTTMRDLFRGGRPHGLGEMFDIRHQDFPYHWKETYLCNERYKLNFVLSSLRLKLYQLTHSTVKLYGTGEYPSHLIVTNCTLRWEEGSNITIYVHGNPHQHHRPLSSDETTLDLANLYPDQPCHIITHSPILLTFGGQQAILVLKTDGKCHLDLSPCFMEYWTSTSDRRYSPITYTIFNSDFLYNLSCLTHPSCQKKIIPDVLTPGRYTSHTGFHDDMIRYNIIKSIKVHWVKELPYFFIGDKPLQVTHRYQNNTLIHEGMTLATFDAKRERREIVFYIIYGEDSQPVDFLDYYVY